MKMDAVKMDAVKRDAVNWCRRWTADLSRLTGLRSGKSSFYPQYRGAAERLERVVHALELISRALVRTVEGPETLVCAVAEAARAHLECQLDCLRLG